MSFMHVPWMISLVLLVALLSVPAAALTPDGDNDARARRFVEYYNATVRPLEIEAARPFWTANVTGKEEDFRKKQEAEEKLESALSDPRAIRRVEGHQAGRRVRSAPGPEIDGPVSRIPGQAGGS